ncbi:MAG: hypothetical protein KF729_00445 [Sandaracinaceae bacterium]|nr:hypothetical protein [Sandaracinaceae bacterium]
MRAALLASLALALVGCVPNLGGWRVVREGEDAGRPPPSRDAGRPLPVPDCTSPIVLGAGYREGFEAGPGGWGVTTESERTPASWEWGRPTGAQITRASEGEHAFVTRLAEPYDDHDASLLVSPCFDASAARADLLVSLDWTVFSEQCCDRLSLEYTADGGETWQLATGEARIGFYPGVGWSGAYEWQRGSTLLPGTAGSRAVQVRLRFRSDGSAIGGDGAAIDDFELRPASFDLAMSASEAARCGWMVATVTNVGGLPVTGFEIRGEVDGVETLRRPFDDTLGYLATQTVEIGGPLATTTRATVSTVGDEDASNDAASWGHASQPFTGYFSDFEADDGGLYVMGAPSSWAWGTPAGALIRSAASGSRAWMTGLGAGYGNNERGALMLPCYDMRAHTRDPQVSLSRAYQTEACCDFGRVEVSIDGADFVTVGTPTSGGTNWYAMARGWSGSSGAGQWMAAQHPLMGAAGHGAVRVRVLFHSDGSAGGEGFGIDDLALVP